MGISQQCHLVVNIKHLCWSSDLQRALHDDGQEGAKHTDCLETVCPDNRLDAADTGVENADKEDDPADDLDIVVDTMEEAGDLEQDCLPVTLARPG